ncbi:spore cortex biosynthesis protein YabQ [Konateibacter massiliensis]|uniref:spore cortex biosynthesis protein YabQ n=1 Tax=Konateibacter massiliensis TaxID=2002841 RepID=UPI000C15440D|nr:spore cortex biosynthesis protein YabQ [Konateibacter massiliensis]
MSQNIINEVYFFGCCVLTGVAVISMYDVLRIFRRIVKHGVFAVGLEDFLYWVGSGFFVFHIIYIRNDGVIRGFAILAIVLGMLLYNVTVSRLIVKYISLVLKTILDIILFPIKWILKKCSNILKKYYKAVKIRLSKQKGESGCKYDSGKSKTKKKAEQKTK